MDTSTDKDYKNTIQSDVCVQSQTQKDVASTCQTKATPAPYQYREQLYFNRKFCTLRSKTIAELQAQANLGDFDSIAELGYRLYTGEGITPDKNKALNLLEPCAARDNVMGILNLSTIFLDYDFPKNKLKWIRKKLVSLIDDKTRIAQVYFLCALIQDKTNISGETTAKYYQKALCLDLPLIYYKLALKASSLEESCKYGVKAWEKGYLPVAKDFAAWSYASGMRRVKKGWLTEEIEMSRSFYPKLRLEFFETLDCSQIRLSAQEISWIKTAADMGYDEYAFYLGRYFRHNPSEGDCLEYLNQAAASDDLIIEFKAAIEIVLLYKDGNCNYERDPKKAQELALQL